uniref:C-type lectin domain-containing protein n=1 Tax=Steinernema glaseri TaxID=37863 RepID=A0A1I7YX20_9BILA
MAFSIVLFLILAMFQRSFAESEVQLTEDQIEKLSYVIPLGANTIFVGVVGTKNLTGMDVLECAEAWKSDPPPGFSYDHEKRTCVPYKKIYGLIACEGVDTFLMPKESQRKVEECSSLSDEEEMEKSKEHFNSIAECMPGWTSLTSSLPPETFCYGVVENSNNMTFEKYISTACQSNFSTALPASIRNQEEEEFIKEYIIDKTRMEIITGLRFGTDCHKRLIWGWSDGARSTYENLNATQIREDCTGKNCSYGGLFQLGRGKQAVNYWGVVTNASLPLLCKYQLTLS